MRINLSRKTEGIDMNYFNVLELLSQSFPSMRMTVDVVKQVANTEIEINGKGDYRYKLEKVGWDLCFGVFFLDFEFDTIINLPQETEVEFLSRIISLINCYK